MAEPADPYAYLTLVVRFADRVTQEGLAAFRDGLAPLGKSGRPPLYTFLTIPFVLAFGRSLDAALFINVVFHAATLVLTHAIAKLAMNARAGLLAALLVASYAPIVNLSRIYRPHAALPACVALSLLLLILLVQNRSRKTAWLFGASLAFGALIHPYFLTILAAPTAVYGTYLLLTRSDSPWPPGLRGSLRWLAQRLRNPFVMRGLLPGAVIALAPILLWNLTEGSSLFSLVRSIGGRAGGLAYGFPKVEPNFWWYARTAPGALSSVLAVFGLMGLVLCAFKRSLPIRVLVLTLVAGYPIIVNWFQTWRYFAPLLIVVAVLTAVSITAIRHRLLSRALSTACVAVAIFSFSLLTWEMPAWSRPVARLLGAPLDRYPCRPESRALALCPTPPQGEPWPAHEVLRVVLTDEDCERDRVCRLAVVPGRLYPAFFRFHLARDWPESTLNVVLWVDPVMQNRQARAADPANDYILYLHSHHRAPAARSPFPEMSPASGEAYRTATFEFPEGITATLLKRVAPGRKPGFDHPGWAAPP
jgi:hypothetical protein